MQPPAPAERPRYLTGVELGNYLLHERLGQGGMGVVYRGLDRQLNRQVAVKVLQPQAMGEEFIRRFAQEAAIMASLQHPHILPIFDYGESDGVLYLVTPFIQGGTMQARLRLGLPVGQGLTLLRQVCQALAYAHGRGVVHRDVKPANVLLGDERWALLGDFGLARQEESSLRLTRTGLVLGTPEFIAPEQAAGARGDHRADLYAVGVLLYQVLTGQLPFRASTPMGVLLNHLQAPVPLPSAEQPALPHIWDEVVARALAKEPTARYQTMEELVASMDQARQATPGLGGHGEDAEQLGSAAPGEAGTPPPPGPPAPTAGRWSTASPAPPTSARRPRAPLDATGPAAGAGAGSAAGGAGVGRGAEDSPAHGRALDRAYRKAEALADAGEITQAQGVLQVLLQQVPGHAAAAQLLQRLQLRQPITERLAVVPPTTAIALRAPAMPEPPAPAVPAPARRLARPRGAVFVALSLLVGGLALLAEPVLEMLDPALGRQVVYLFDDDIQAVAALAGAAVVVGAVLALILPWPRDRRHGRRTRWEAAAVALSLAMLVGGVAFALVELEYLARPSLVLAVNGGMGLTLTLLGLALLWGAIGGPPTADRLAAPPAGR